jgi:hypothetical protein
MKKLLFLLLFISTNIFAQVRTKSVGSRPFNLCDTLNSLPNTTYSSGMKLITTGGASVPVSWIGYDFDMTNLNATCGTTDLTGYSVTDIQHCVQSIPSTPILCTDVTAINSFINSNVIPDYNACSGQPPLVAGDVIYVYNADNTATMWVNPAISYPFHNLVLTNGICGEKYSLIY